MKSAQKLCVVVALFVSATIGFAFNNAHANQIASAAKARPTPPTDPWDPERFGIVDYESDETLEPGEKERRKRKNQGYDNEKWVQPNPHPETGKIGRFREIEPPPTIPAQESELIVTGRVVDVTTHLSNDKTGVYSEYRIKVDKSLKKNSSIDLEPGGFVTVDRAGGMVRYPNHQTVIYLDSEYELPEVGKEYVFFLTDGKGGNYKIFTLYELQETSTVPLDSGRKMDEIKRMGKSDFLKAIREKLLVRNDK